MELRNWKATPLDFTTKPESFLAWQHRAVSVLSGNRLDIRRLLDWALTCKAPIDATAAQTGARAVGLCQSDDVTTSASNCSTP